MAITWLDISTLTVFFSLAAILAGNAFSYLRRQDAQEARRNHQDACSHHAWVRTDSAGLTCQLCGKIPG